jgi:hypothetical protein
MKQKLTAIFLGFLFAAPAFAQDYPYEDSSQKKIAPPRDDLPVESPDELAKAGQFKKRTSIFRMAVKGGGNFSVFQLRGDTDAENLSLNGFGAEGRLAFGWDMAFQPIYLETEFGYRGINANTLSPVHVIVMQQGLYYRERLGKTTMWKPGILSSLDIRIEPLIDGSKETTLLPAVGFSSMWEFGAVLFQISAYIHRIGTARNFISGSVLGGLKF